MRQHGSGTRLHTATRAPSTVTRRDGPSDEPKSNDGNAECLKKSEIVIHEIVDRRSLAHLTLPTDYVRSSTVRLARVFATSSSTGRSSPRCCRSSSPWPAASRCCTLPIAQYPGDHAADGRGLGRLSRRQCPGRGRHRRRPDRAAGQRRREHAVHVVAMHQRRHLHAHGDLPERRRSEHGPGAGAEPRLAGPADPARPGQAPRRDGQEEVAQRADDRQPVLARQQPRQPVPEQLRHHPAQGRAVAAHGRRRHHLPRASAITACGSGSTREDGIPAT